MTSICPAQVSDTGNKEAAMIAIIPFLVYLLTGSLLISRNMRGFDVNASLTEWVILIFLWPFSLRLFALLSIMQNTVSNLKDLSKDDRAGDL